MIWWMLRGPDRAPGATAPSSAVELRRLAGNRSIGIVLALTDAAPRLCRCGAGTSVVLAWYRHQSLPSPVA